MLSSKLIFYTQELIRKKIFWLKILPTNFIKAWKQKKAKLSVFHKEQKSDLNSYWNHDKQFREHDKYITILYEHQNH